MRGFVIGALVVAIGVLGYLYWDAEHNTVFKAPGVERHETSEPLSYRGPISVSLVLIWRERTGAAPVASAYPDGYAAHARCSRGASG
jgi:hypothetical protein